MSHAETEAIEALGREPEPRFINREVSWLDYNARVLALAEEGTLPVLERVRFLAIFSQNLDEFFQVRVAGLKEQVLAGLGSTAPDGMSPAEQLRAIRERVADLAVRQSEVFEHEVVPQLEKAGIRFSDWGSLDDEDREHLDREFRDRIFPVLTPLSVDPAHPFPYISNLSLNLAVVVRDHATRDRRFARVKVPPLLPRFIVLPDGERFVPLETLIATHLQTLFPGMEVEAHFPFRVTRDADIDLEEEETGDLRTAIETALRRRRRSPLVVRLEVDHTMPEEVLRLLLRELELEPTEVTVAEGSLDLGGLWALYNLDRPDLKDGSWTPVTEARLADAVGHPEDLFQVLREGDILVHHPYDSFTSSVEAFIDQAARDPAVLAIKQTLYRTSGSPVSPIVRALIRAAEGGKQVVALVELQARFDEQANIVWAQALEAAGVHVVYGVVGLKTHAKVALVVRREGEQIRRYVHVGTGNYNPNTASIYEDIGLLSADQELGADLSDLFNYLTGYSRQREYRRLVVAPLSLRSHLLGLIEREAARGEGGRIVIKANSLLDPEIIEALYAASSAGASVDLVIRGICALRPGVPGLSDRIRVRSIVGRYLEHSRIFRFGSDPETADLYIGSADLMPRNLDRRVEELVPISDPALRARVDEILSVDLADDLLAWELGRDGSWTRAETVEGVNAQVRLQELALARTRGAGGKAGA